MAKDKEKQSDDKLVLTEWQKRNIEFLKKKRSSKLRKKKTQREIIE